MRILFVMTFALVGSGFQTPESSLVFEYGQFVDTRDNRIYRTTKIGNQVWLAENFAYLPFICKPDSANCGVWIYDFMGSDIVEAKKLTEYKTYGALYSWEMANKLAPNGWHLPSDKEWETLEKYIGISESEINGGVWRGDNDKVARLKTNGDIGLNVVFGGWMTDFGKSNFIGQHANFWCSTEFDEGRAYERLLGLSNGKIGRDKGNKGCGFSVRYIKD